MMIVPGKGIMWGSGGDVIPMKWHDVKPVVGYDLASNSSVDLREILCGSVIEQTPTGFRIRRKVG